MTEAGGATARLEHGVHAAAKSTHVKEQREETRRSTLVAGSVALAALPAWAAFDWLMVPSEAPRFLVVRLSSVVSLSLLCLTLWRLPVGRRHPEALSLSAVAVVEVAIAWMVPRVGGQLEPYLLGMSLGIYATAFLVVWRWRMGVALGVITAAAVTVFSLTAPTGL
ncbi:MAG TPA: hypothetical protein VHK88_08980, partial [Aquihabitans sp.]|nr:hypothetical protein [Aquihabitans sp.]